MKEIKDFINEKKEGLNDLRKIIKDSIIFEQLDLEDFEWNIEQNLEYHTARHNGNLTKDSDTALIFNTLINKFVEEVHKKTNIEDGKMSLYRAISLEKIEDLSPELGIYWSFDKNKTFVFDDEGYDHKENNKENYKRFEFNAEISLSDINWVETFDIYIIQEFGESEIRLNNSTKFYNVSCKESGEDEFKKIENFGVKNINLKNKKSQKNRIFRG